MKRRIARQQHVRQRRVRQVVARQRKVRRNAQLAAQRIVRKKKNSAARAKAARPRRVALASPKAARKYPAAQRHKAKRAAVQSLQTSHKPQLLEQARGWSTYGVQDNVPALNRADKKGVQLALSRAGFYGGAADGLFGPKTRSAIKDYQKSLGQDRTGRLDSIQMSSLLQAVSRNTVSGNSYLPQGDQKYDRQEKIKKQARLLAGRSQLPTSEKAVLEPKKIKFTKLAIKRKAKPFIAVRPKKLGQQASLRVNQKKNEGKLSALPGQGSAQKMGALLIDPKAARRVDYVHTLGRTRHGETLWVVKCLDKKQLRLYFWRDKQWWTRGKEGGSVGFSEYGSGGIKNLAGKVCTL